MLDYQGEKFKEYLQSTRWNVQDAAKLLGVSRQTIYQYFKSKNLTREVVNTILQKFNTTEHDVWGIPASEPKTYEPKPITEMQSQKIIALQDELIETLKEKVRTLENELSEFRGDRKSKGKSLAS